LTLILVGVAVIGVIAAIAFLFAGGSTPTAAAVENRAVTVTGSTLVPLPDDDRAVDSAVGSTAPRLAGKSFAGEPVLVDPGKPTLLIGLAHWCSHCRAEVPRLVEWWRQGGVPTGVDVIGISTAVVEQRPNYPPSAWLEKEQFPWPVIADSIEGDAATAIGLTSFPYFVMLAEDGTVLWRASGELEMQDLELMISQSLEP
jgi:thiol-disulfide isomerase/thioredoxin